MRTTVGNNATWPLMSVPPKGFDEEIYLCDEIARAELAGIPAMAMGVRFETARGTFVF
ncbi:MAG: hypothetical protein WEB06_17645 [Actinomycetota bacterium]